MKLKLDAEGHVVLSDGKPVYVHDDGKEVAFDAPATVAKIGQLNGEARAHREAKETAEGKLKAFEGIDDPVAAKDALKRIGNLKDGDLLTAGKVEEIKAAAIKAVEEKWSPFKEKAETLERELIGEKIGGSFARSKFITEKAAIPADMVQARFGSQFKLEEGKVVAYDQHGNKIYSRANPGELADFDEGLETLISAYPYKDQILKGTGSNGGGARPGAGGSGGAKVMSRSEFNRLDLSEQGAKARDGYTITDD